MRSFDRFTVAIVIAVVALIVIAFLLVMLPQDQEPLDESTPQGVVTAYLRQIRSPEPDLAYDYLASSLRETVTLEDFLLQIAWTANDDRRVTVHDASVTESTARVSVSYAANRSLFGSSSFTETFLLATEADNWRISLVPRLRPMRPILVD